MALDPRFLLSGVYCSPSLSIINNEFPCFVCMVVTGVGGFATFSSEMAAHDSALSIQPLPLCSCKIEEFDIGATEISLRMVLSASIEDQCHP